ncbi:uncharacterized protein LOC126909907, partial [Daktulosphaira vitifoliae]
MSRGCTYCLTAIDRFSRWPEVFPIQDISAETIARTLFEGWIARYGVMERLTTDQGRQFESTLFTAVTQILGFRRIRTSAYHPPANGLVERFHRSLKTAIKCYETEHWTDVLPSVLMGLRSVIKEDLGLTPAEIVFGSTIRLPNEFFMQSSVATDPCSFAETLKKTMETIRPVSTSNHGSKKVFIYKDLASCSHVFVRVDRVKKPLEQPYEGPYKIVQRYEKTFKLLIRQKECIISIDRLKPCFNENEDNNTNLSITTNQHNQRNTTTRPTIIQTKQT